MLKKLAPLCLLVCCLFAACEDGVIFEKSISIPDGQWRYAEPLNFEFDIADTSARYALLLNVEHAGDYGFQNLYVQFHTTFPSGQKGKRVVSLELAASNGTWLGECSGNRCELEIPLQVSAIFPETGTHQIVVEQYMRKDPLPGVLGMTLRVREKRQVGE